jgi:hypothetical protein
MTMISRLLFVPLAFVAMAAHADIYAWADAAGKITYSDAAPPKGARILNVVRTPPARPKSAAESAAEAAASASAAHDAEIRALSERIRLLERELDRATLAAPPANAYAPSPCGPDGWDCNSWWSGPIYGAPLGAFDRRHGDHHHFAHANRPHVQPLVSGVRSAMRTR